jgi:hypothetical protein
LEVLSLLSAAKDQLMMDEGSFRDFESLWRRGIVSPLDLMCWIRAHTTRENLADMKRFIAGADERYLGAVQRDLARYYGTGLLPEESEVDEGAILALREWVLGLPGGDETLAELAAERAAMIVPKDVADLGRLWHAGKLHKVEFEVWALAMAREDNLDEFKELLASLSDEMLCRLNYDLSSYQDRRIVSARLDPNSYEVSPEAIYALRDWLGSLPRVKALRERDEE